MYSYVKLLWKKKGTSVYSNKLQALYLSHFKNLWSFWVVLESECMMENMLKITRIDIWTREKPKVEDVFSDVFRWTKSKRLMRYNRDYNADYKVVYSCLERNSEQTKCNENENELPKTSSLMISDIDLHVSQPSVVIINDTWNIIIKLKSIESIWKAKDSAVFD